MPEVHDRRAISLQRRHLDHGLIGLVIHLPQRILRIEPLRILLVPVEDERRADIVVVDQLLHVLHGRTVAKGEAELRLHALVASQRGGTQRFRVIVRDGLLAEDVLPRFDRSPAERQMRCAWGAHVHEIDVRARDEFLVRRIDIRDPELLRELVRLLDNRIRDGHQLTSRVALVAWQMRKLRPCARAEHAHLHLRPARDPSPGAGHQLMIADASPGRSSCRCAQMGAMPFVMIRSWNARRLNVAPIFA